MSKKKPKKKLSTGGSSLSKLLNASMNDTIKKYVQDSVPTMMRNQQLLGLLEKRGVVQMSEGNTQVEKLAAHLRETGRLDLAAQVLMINDLDVILGAEWMTPTMRQAAGIITWNVNSFGRNR